MCKSLILAAVLVACSSGGGASQIGPDRVSSSSGGSSSSSGGSSSGSSGTSSGGPGAGYGPVSGTRLKVRYESTTFADGAGYAAFAGYFDTKRNEPCDFVPGANRCMPSAAPVAAFAAAYPNLYGDAACTNQLGAMYSAGASPKYFRDVAGKIYAAGAPVPMYQKSGSCQPAGGLMFVPAGGEIAPTEFVDGTQSEVVR